MDNLKFDNGMYESIRNCNSVNELAQVVLQLIEKLSVWQKVLQDTLSNLDSDNIQSIDFSVVDCKNLDKVLEKYITIN